MPMNERRTQYASSRICLPSFRGAVGSRQADDLSKLAMLLRYDFRRTAYKSIPGSACVRQSIERTLPNVDANRLDAVHGVSEAIPPVLHRLNVPVLVPRPDHESVVAATPGRPFCRPLLPGVLVRHARELGGLPRFSKVVANLDSGDPSSARPSKARGFLHRPLEDLAVARPGVSFPAAPLPWPAPICAAAD